MLVFVRKGRAMKCCCKNPLTAAEKEHIIKEAEKIRPLSESEKELLIKNAEAERARGVCHEHCHVMGPDWMRKMALLFGVLALLGLLYYLFIYRAMPHVSTATPMEQREQSPSVAQVDAKSQGHESRQEVVASPIANADKIMVEEVIKEPAAAQVPAEKIAP